MASIGEPLGASSNQSTTPNSTPGATDAPRKAVTAKNDGSPTAASLGGNTTASDPSKRTTAESADMLARVVAGAHQTIDRLAESAAPHVHRLQEGVGALQEGVGAKAEQVKEVGDEWAESLRSTVREHPLAAVATALAVGVLIARLTR